MEPPWLYKSVNFIIILIDSCKNITQLFKSWIFSSDFSKVIIRIINLGHFWRADWGWGGLEGASNIMVTPKLGVASILCLNFIIWNLSVLGAGRQQSFDCGRPASSLEGFRIIPSNPQLTLTVKGKLELFLFVMTMNIQISKSS